MDELFDLKTGINTALLNGGEEVSLLQPRLITNNADDTVLNHIQLALAGVTDFTFVVAFITESGLVTLKSQLADLAAQGVRGRLITASYLNFNQPKAFRELLKISNLDVRISSQSALHSKAYIFNYGEYYSAIIGSANLTQNALQRNTEWNLQIFATKQGNFTGQLLTETETLWLNAQPLTTTWIDQYENYLANQVEQVQQDRQPEFIASDTIKPNKMQERALAALAHTRASGATRGLIVSATGTGKTYLAALELAQVNPKRVLFIVHREQILLSARDSFKRVLGGPDNDYGVLSGNSRDLTAKYTFATVNTLSKATVLEQFDQQAFDYIIIDEAHRINQSVVDDRMTMYERIIKYFKPKFMLGMTATPDRTDGNNIYEYFDHNIIYEISLLDALEADLLTPFHYIGVTDFEWQGEQINDRSQLKYLIADERVDYLLAKTAYYGYSGQQLFGLIFVSRIAEGEALATALNKRQIGAEFISGAQSIAQREAAIERLRSGQLQYLITVDVFNEGIDIVEINQVVMMRPTTSRIVFLQQLGRGLRKAVNKEYVTVIDFIGNYENNYLIPLALDPKHNANKEQLLNTVMTPEIVGVSTINFEEMAQKQLLDSIRKVNLSASQRFKAIYQNVANRTGHALPMLTDFVHFSDLTIDDIVEKYTTVLQMQAKFTNHELIPTITALENNWLIFFNKEIANSKRILETATMQLLLTQGQVTDQELETFFTTNGFFFDDESLDSVASVLTYEYFLTTTARRFGETAPVIRQGTRWQLSPAFTEALQNLVFKQYIDDTVMAGWDYLTATFDNQVRFELNAKYYRRDIIKGLGWAKEQTGLVVGGYVRRSDSRFLPVFITIDKTEQVNSVDYKNEFISDRVVTFYSKTNRTLTSPLEATLAATDEFGRIQVYIRQNNEVAQDGRSFYYLGSAKVTKTAEMTMLDQEGRDVPMVRFDLQLEHPLTFSMAEILLN